MRYIFVKYGKFLVLKPNVNIYITMNTVYYIDTAASCIPILFTVMAEHACSFLNPNHIGAKCSFIIVRGEGSTLSYVFILTYFFYFELKLYVIFMTKAVSN